MLKSERAALVALGGAVADLLRAPSMSKAPGTAKRVQSAVARLVAKQRQLARKAARSHAEALLSWAGKFGEVGADVAKLGSMSADERRARRIGKAAGRRYVDKLKREVDGGARDGDALLRAGAGLLTHMELVAATETASAWSEEMRRQGDHIAKRQEKRDPAATIIIVKEWSAELDRRTCPVCEGADGTIRPLGMSFPAGEPGAVHPRCRCQEFWWPVPLLLPGER
jgi:hypothetical protein